MLEEVIKSILASGPLAATLFLMWWLERSERIEKQKQKDALDERTLTALINSTEALKENAEFFESLRNKG